MKEIDQSERSIISIYKELTHLFFTRFHTSLVRKGAHPGQIPMLRLLFKQEGLSQKEIADYLKIKPPTVAVGLKRMEKNGFLIRRPDEKDQRIMRVYLTKSGKDLSIELAQSIKQLENELFEGFTEAELCLLKRLFAQMLENIRNNSPVHECRHIDPRHEHKE